MLITKRIKKFYAVYFQYAREVFEHGEQTLTNRRRVIRGSQENILSLTGNAGQKRTARTADQDVYQTTDRRTSDRGTEPKQKNSNVDDTIT